MPLSRIDEVLRVLKMDFADLARVVADARPRARELTLDQEKAVVQDRRLLLFAICCLSEWPFEHILATYALTEAELVAGLARPRPPRHDRAAAAQPLQPQGAKGFRWRADGP
jgi:hypothetical protein